MIGLLIKALKCVWRGPFPCEINDFASNEKLFRGIFALFAGSLRDPNAPPLCVFQVQQNLCVTHVSLLCACNLFCLIINFPFDYRRI